MIEHLTKDQFENYSRRKLSAQELLSISHHLSTCEMCRQQLETALDADSTFFAIQAQVFNEAEDSSPVWAHPTIETTADYIDGALSKDEMQTVTDHLSHCERCAVAVDDLRAFRNQVVPALSRRHQPVMVPAPTEPSSYRGRAFIPRLFSRSPALAWGTALVALLLVVIGFVILQKLHQGETGPGRSAAIAPKPSPAPAAVIAELNDGGRRLVLDQEGKVSGAEDLSADHQLLLKQALMRQHLGKSPLLAGLNRPASSLKGADKPENEFFLNEPIGKVVMTDRPTFGWYPLDGATGYLVEVYDENFNLVVASSQLAATSWTPSQPLRRGAIYSWQVKAIKDGREFRSPHPPAPEAKFRILDQERMNEFVETQRVHPSSHLMLGLLYVRAGLLDEAEREFRTSQAANVNSQIVLQLLEDVQAMRR